MPKNEAEAAHGRVPASEPARAPGRPADPAPVSHKPADPAPVGETIDPLGWSAGERAAADRNARGGR
jgi:hypothetical protein